MLKKKSFTFKRKTAFVTLVALSILGIIPAQAGMGQTNTQAVQTTVTDNKLVLAKKLVLLDGSLDAIKTANKIIIEEMKLSMPRSTPEAFFEKLTDNMSQYDYHTDNAKLYAQLLTETELNALINFYQSPIGSGIAKKTVTITEAIAKQQQEIGLKLMEKTMQEIDGNK